MLIRTSWSLVIRRLLVRFPVEVFWARHWTPNCSWCAVCHQCKCKMCIHCKSHICKSLWIKLSAKCKCKIDLCYSRFICVIQDWSVLLKLICVIHDWSVLFMIDLCYSWLICVIHDWPVLFMIDLRCWSFLRHSTSMYSWQQ